MTNSDRRQALLEQVETVERELFEHVEARGSLAVVQAPPGSGKTWLLLRAVAHARGLGLRVAIATQTNSQADDICRRFARDYPALQIVRFAGGGSPPVAFGRTVIWETSVGNLPHDACIVVGTAAKWGLVNLDDPFDVLFIEEAWQLSWADFMLLDQVAPRFVLIGDPGQIPPVVSVDVARWETSPRPPHLAAPKIILEDPGLRPERWSLPATRRLPSDTATLIGSFYDFSFDSFAGPGERRILSDPGGNGAHDNAVSLLVEGSTTGFTIPTPDGGPPLEQDEQLAAEAAALVTRLFARSAKVQIDGETRPLEPTDVGLCATHRVMNTALDLALPQELRGRVVVDTPERWQGLERPLMLVVHPLSGVVSPSAFDLHTGRLCVMASRHRAALVVLSRDHLADTLGGCIPFASQALGRPDVIGRGLRDNLGFWRSLVDAGRVVQA